MSNACLLALAAVLAGDAQNPAWRSAAIVPLREPPKLPVHAGVPLVSQIDPGDGAGLELALGADGSLEVKRAAASASGAAATGKLTRVLDARSIGDTGNTAPVRVDVEFDTRRGLWVARGLAFASASVADGTLIVCDRDANGAISTDGRDAYWSSAAEEWFPLRDAIQWEAKQLAVRVENGALQHQPYAGELGELAFLKNRPAAVSRFAFILASDTSGWIAVSHSLPVVSALPGSYRLVRGTAFNHRRAKGDVAAFVPLTKRGTDELAARGDEALAVRPRETLAVDPWKLRLAFDASHGAGEASVPIDQFRVLEIAAPQFYRPPAGLSACNSMGWSVGGFATGIFEEGSSTQMKRYAAVASVSEGKRVLATDDAILCTEKKVFSVPIKSAKDIQATFTLSDTPLFGRLTGTVAVD